LRKPTFPA